MALTDNLLGYYNFNSGSLADYFGSGPSFTNTSTAVNYNGGRIADAWAFHTYQSSGSQSRLTATDNAFTMRLNSGDPDAGVTRTFAFWAYNANGDWNNQPGIISNWANGGPVQFLFFAVSASHLDWQVRDKTSTDHICHIAAPTVGAWHFYVCYYNSANGELGVSIDNGAFTTTTTPSVIHGTGAIALGNRNGGAAGFKGAIDILGVWSRMLTSGEITQLYNSGAGLEAPFAVTPVADFSGAPVSGIAPLEVDFSDESSNTPTSWVWDFGDGDDSTEQDPTHTYDTPGDYTVTLTATNAAGSDDEEKEDYVHVEAPVVAAFSADRTTVKVGGTVSFTDESTGDPTAWAWNFGDGGASSSQNPSHQFNQEGVFTVTLTASKTGPNSSDGESHVIQVTDERQEIFFCLLSD